MINFEEMEKRALIASDKEAFQVLDSGIFHRIGICVQIGINEKFRYILEIILSLGKPRVIEDIDKIHNFVNLVAYFFDRGYITRLQEDGSFLFEKGLEKSAFELEYERIIRLDQFPP